MPARYILTVISFLGITLNFVLRININLAVRAMAKPMNFTNHSGLVVNQCGFDYDEENIEDYVSSHKHSNINLNIILY